MNFLQKNILDIFSDSWLIIVALLGFLLIPIFLLMVADFSLFKLFFMVIAIVLIAFLDRIQEIFFTVIISLLSYSLSDPLKSLIVSWSDQALLYKIIKSFHQLGWIKFGLTIFLCLYLLRAVFGTLPTGSVNQYQDNINGNK